MLAWAFPFTFAGANRENGIFDIIDILTANIMLPLGGLAMAIFTGWLMSRTSSVDELKVKQNIYNAWRFVIRYLSPVGVTIIFLNSIGVL